MSEIIKYSLRENPARLDKAPTMGVPPLYFDTLEEAKAVQEKEFSAFGFGDDVIISPLTEEICKKELERMLIWFFYEHEFGLNASSADMCIFEESFNPREHFALEAAIVQATEKTDEEEKVSSPYTIFSLTKNKVGLISVKAIAQTLTPYKGIGFKPILYKGDPEAWVKDGILCSNRWCKGASNDGTNKKLCVIYDPMWIKCHLHHCNPKDVIWYFYSFFDQWFVQREHLMYGIKARNLI